MWEECMTELVFAGASAVLVEATGGSGGRLGLALALFGTVLTFVVGVVTVVSGSRAKEQELLIKSLEFLSGGTQRRAGGIALAEEYRKVGRHREKIDNVLRAQLLYLKTKGFHAMADAEEGSLEEFNYRRLEKLVGSRDRTRSP
jgi:hypothetical protein